MVTNLFRSLVFILILSSTLLSLTLVEVRVDGLSCPFCAFGLEKKLKAIKGAKEIEIDLDKGKALFKLEGENTIEKEKVIAIVKEAGFTAKSVQFSNSDTK